MEQNPPRSGATGNRPRLAIIAISIWVLLQIPRLAALPIIQSVLAGNDSTAWLYPAFVDTFIGITAPFLAFALWRRTGLWVWMTALIWFSISLFDHLDATTAALISPIPQAFMEGNQSTVLTSLLIGAVLDAIFLVVLTRRTMKSHYLGAIRTSDSTVAYPRTTMVITIVWVILQIPRYIAIPLVQNILAGNDPEAWLNPAIGDIIIATSAFFVLFAVWRKKGLWVWATVLIWLALSIFDHLSTVTAALTTPGPQLFGGGGPSASVAAVPFIQAVIDAVVFVLLARGKVRSYFLGP